MTLDSTSTATVSSATPTDPAFLGGYEELSFTLEEVEASPAGGGNAIYDAIAHLSALRRARDLGLRGSIVHRTDGELPDWIDGAKPVTMEVGQRDVSAEVLAKTAELEQGFSSVTRERVRGKANLADSIPIRDVISRARAEARRVA